DPGTDLLDRRDQRVGEQHDPRDREAELRAGLAIGRDPAGVVVGRSRDEPRAEHAYESRLFRIGRGSGTDPPCCYRHRIFSAPLGDDGMSASRKPNREIAAEAGRSRDQSWRTPHWHRTHGTELRVVLMTGNVQTYIYVPCTTRLPTGGSSTFQC